MLYLSIFPSAVRIILNKPNNTLVGLYILFLKTSYGLDTKKINDGTFDVTFKIEQIEEKDFIQYSQGRYETLKEYNTSLSTIRFNQQQVQNAKTFSQNTNTKCDNIITPDLYIDTTKDEWKRKNDKILLDWFFDNKEIVAGGPLKEYAGVTIGNSYQILTKNFSKTLPSNVDKNFYITSNNFIENNGLVNKKGSISVSKIENNLQEAQHQACSQTDEGSRRSSTEAQAGVSDESVISCPISTTRRAAIRPRSEEHTSELQSH